MGELVRKEFPLVMCLRLTRRGFHKGLPRSIGTYQPWAEDNDWGILYTQGTRRFVSVRALKAAFNRPH